MIKITNEMVKRAYDKMEKDCIGPITTNMVRAALEAALNPPASPEIPVSEGMLMAAWGVASWSAVHNDSIAKKYALDLAATLYRAMESKRREEEKPPFMRLHRRVGDGKLEAGTYRSKHRRATDK